MKILGLPVVPEGWRWPRSITHVLDSESKSVGFGYQVFYAATYGAMFARKGGDIPVIDSDKWMFAVIVSSALVAGKLGREMYQDFLKAKFPQEGKPNAAAPASPAV